MNGLTAPPSPILINADRTTRRSKLAAEQREEEQRNVVSPLSPKVQAVALNSARRGEFNSVAYQDDDEGDDEEDPEESAEEGGEFDDSGKQEQCDDQEEEDTHEAEDRHGDGCTDAGYGEGETKIKWRVADVEYLREEMRPKFQKENMCSACGAVFTFSKRRHHCRNCGMSFCQKHSNCYIAIPKYGFDEPVRVCKGCYGRMIKTKMQDTRTNLNEETRPAQLVGVLSKPPAKGILKESVYTCDDD